jgi:hypothetical protein
MKENFPREVAHIARQEPLRVLSVSINSFRRFETQLEAEGRHFEYLLNDGGKLNCRGKTKSKLPVDAGFRCNKAPARAAGLRDAIRNARGTFV